MSEPFTEQQGAGPARSLCDILDVVRERDLPDLLRYRPGGAASFHALSAARFLADIERCAAGLRTLGVSTGDRVGLICANRPEWHVTDFGCHRVGAVVVPLFDTLTAAQLRYCFGNSGCTVVVVEAAEQADKLGDALASEELGDVRWVVTIGESYPERREGPELDEAPRSTGLDAEIEATVEIDAAAEAGAAGECHWIGFAALLDLADRSRPAAEDSQTSRSVRCEPPPSGDDLATIIYTSGTTGPPKGVMLSHANILANIEGVQRRVPTFPGDVGMSVLPLCHVYERMIDYNYLMAGARVVYSSPAEAGADMRQVQPTILIGVPRLFEKIRQAIESRAAQASPMKRALFGWAQRCGLRYARRRLERPEGSDGTGAGSSVGLFLRFSHRLAERLVLSKVRDGLGGRLRLISAGGAALPVSVNWWFLSFGWNLVQGYGLTESSPVISVNAVDTNRVGSVGAPLDNAEVRIAEDGEVLTRGPHVMRGYWNDPEATAATVVNGWLHTGDMGRMGADGCLYITDRKKELLVTSTGKNVGPQQIEGLLSESPFISQVMAIGDGRPFIAALIVPEYERLTQWVEAYRLGLPTDRESMCSSDLVQELYLAELQRLQVDLARYEKVRAFRLLPESFSVKAGELTPTLKLVRRVVAERYGDLMEEIYSSRGA